VYPGCAHRHRLLDFFDFYDYVECFVPQPKRKYGYLYLPVLVGGRFVTGMEAKADRKSKTLLIRNMHFEMVNLNEDEVAKLIEALKCFALFNQCQQVEINPEQPQRLSCRPQSFLLKKSKARLSTVK
jgi:uncharacterized protein